MTSIAFTVPGVPVGKGRARVATIAGRARMYTPAKTVSYEAVIAQEAKIAMLTDTLFLGPVDVTLEINVPIPATWSQKKRRAALYGEIRPSGKPDADNVIKAIFDGMNKIVWKDDAQVVYVAASKRYSLLPRVVVVVKDTELEASDAK